MALEIPSNLSFYGFGEAARSFATGVAGNFRQHVTAWDIKLSQDLDADGFKEAANDRGVTLKASAADALKDADIIFCLVTADQAHSAAQVAAQAGLRSGAIWLDGNSCSPGTKVKSAAVIEAAGGRYVDVAIMAPVLPDIMKTPLLLSGPYAEDTAQILQDLGLKVDISGAKVGDASMLKMLRSVMIKGREALTAECILAARRAGVEEAVIASIQATEKGRDWQKGSAYNLERMMVHGKRRAAEMREVATTLQELGLPDDMTRSTVAWQERISQLGLAGGENSLSDRADRILNKL